MSITVLALTRYSETGASSRVRFLQYIPHLKKLDVDVRVAPLFPQKYLTRLYAGQSRSPLMIISAMVNRLWVILRETKSDIVWLQREILPFAPFIFEKLLLSGRKIVIDLDDAHHLYYRTNTNWAMQALYSDKIDNLVRNADAVVVGNPTLAAYARKIGATNVHELPSAVDVKRYRNNNAQTSDVFEIGWIGTPVTAAQSLPLIQEPLKKFLSEHNAQCTLIGAGENQLIDFPASCVPWSERAEKDVLPRLAVGLCPLEDTAWNRGKSGYKIIQYMAAGIPSLVSPVGIAKDMISNGETGYLCVTSDNWYARLTQLYQEGTLRETIGQKARLVAAEKYDTVPTASALHRVFVNCLND